MALTLPLPGVQDSRVYLGPGVTEELKLIIPGTSDYVTGGYVITAATCNLTHIQGVWLVGQNATASGFILQPVFAIAELGTGGAGVTGYTQFLAKVLVSTTGVEVASSGNLSGAIWCVLIRGY